MASIALALQAAYSDTQNHIYPEHCQNEIWTQRQPWKSSEERGQKNKTTQSTTK